MNLINNTIVSNDSTASSGTLFGAFFAPQASSPTPCPTDARVRRFACVPLSDPQPAGLSSARHTRGVPGVLCPATIICPAGHGVGRNWQRRSHKWRLQDRFVPDSLQRCDLAEPCLQHRRDATGCGIGLDAVHRQAGACAWNDEVTSTGQCFASFPAGELLGYRSAW